MKQYLLSVHHEGELATPEPEVMQQMLADVEAFNEHLLRASCSRRPPRSATGDRQAAPGPPGSSAKPSSFQPSTPPFMRFTGRPRRASRTAALSAPLQCGPAQ